MFASTETKSILIDFTDLPMSLGQYSCARIGEEIFVSKLRRELLIGNPVWNYLYDLEWYDKIGLPDNLKIQRGAVPQNMPVHVFLEKIISPGDTLFVMRLKHDISVISERNQTPYKRESLLYYVINFQGINTHGNQT